MKDFCSVGVLIFLFDMVLVCLQLWNTVDYDEAFFIWPLEILEILNLRCNLLF